LASLVFVFLVVAAVVVESRGRTGAAVAAKLGVKPFLGFLLRRRRRPPDEDEPEFEESSDSSNLLRRSSIMASFDIPFERSGIVVAVGDASFVGIVIG
jgi:hypothetical protein